MLIDLTVIKSIGNFVWGPTLIVLLVGTGIFLSFMTKFIHFRKIKLSIKLLLSKDIVGNGDITPFQSLMTSLAATIGTGNIAGVASAIASGGPGAVFWMWITAAVGGATKYGESLLALKYRIKNEYGEQSGGPMYYIKLGMNDVYGGNWSFLGFIFALFGCIASFGIGNMVQSNYVAQSIYTSIGLSPIITGVIVTIAIGLVTLGGVKSIGKVTEKIVPLMITIYILGAFIILIHNYKIVPNSLMLIFKYAFSGDAVKGGFFGTVVRYGVSRGLFSNEAGLGSAPIAHAASKNNNPASQGLIGSLAVFIDTFLICTITALVILSSGIVHFDPLTGFMRVSGNLSGAALATTAFDMALPGGIGGFIVSFGMIFFSFSTILGWYYYGSKCFEYIVGIKLVEIYKWIWIVLVFIGAVSSFNLIMNISDIFNGLMAFPNLIALLALSPVIYKTTKEFCKSDLEKEIEL